MTDATYTVPRFWRIFLWIAALYNFAAGFAGMFAPGVGVDGMITSLLIACFGLVYALIASDPLRFAPILWAGVAGKLGVVLLLGPSNWGNGGDMAIGIVVAGDLLFALGFIAFLLTVGRKPY
ncbi:hypothetical protein [Qipengyuania sp. MTN3-11]|uniref:hypothetical protein n=1 Tax=Qipengyuania sp. MTN3-11 TaxID=3056557 RepID=UPI0036F30002